MADRVATVRVQREHAPWRDRLRAYKIVVDGTVVDTVSNGASATLPVEPGHHTLRFKIDWAASPTIEFDVADGEEVFFTCRRST